MKPQRLFQIKNYLLLEDKGIGEGCFGQVFKGYDTNTGKLVAIKRIILEDDEEKEIETLKEI